MVESGMRLKPNGKSENGGWICVSAILKEEFSSYEELSSWEELFIHNIPAFFYPKPKSDNFRIFSSDLLESQDPPLTFQKCKKSAKNQIKSHPC